MKLALIFAILATAAIAGSPWCSSWSCKMVKRRCWEPACGVLDYSRNIDYFIYYYKDLTPSLQSQINDNSAQIAANAAKSDAQWSELESELAEANKRQEWFATKTNDEISNLKTELSDAKNSLEETQSQLAETKNEVATVWAKLNEQKDNAAAYEASNNKRVSDLEVLNEDLQSDVSNLRAFVKRNARDNLRYLVMYPNRCGSGCLGGYRRYYGYWSNISVRLASAWRLTYRAAPCWRRKSGMRRLFIRLCRPYGRVAYTNLLPYYDYIWGNKVCDSSFFVGSS